MGTFALVFTDDHRPDLESFAPVLAGLLGLSPIDARLRIRKGRGIFLEQLDEATARLVAEALGANGWAAEVVPQASLVRLPGRPARLFQVDCRDDALHYKRNIAEPFRSVPWDTIRLVHAGVIATPQYRDFVQSQTFRLLPILYQIDDPSARAQLRRAMAKKALEREAAGPAPVPDSAKSISPEALGDLARNQTEACLDLLVDGRPGFLRADRRQVVLDYLGAHGEGNSFENFKRFAADVAARATRAEITPPTRRLLEGEDLPRIVFDDLAEFERYAAWRCLRLGIAPAGGALPAREDEPPQPDDLAVTACPGCGTVVEAEAVRCPYCKSLLRPPRRRRLFWRVFLPFTALWIGALAAGFAYQDLTARNEAIRLVQGHRFLAVATATPLTIDEAIRTYIQSMPGHRGAGWGSSRLGHGVYAVEYDVVRPGILSDSWEVDRILFRVEIETGTVTPLNREAERYLPPDRPPAAPETRNPER
jgi:hypothetical protein